MVMCGGQDPIGGDPQRQVISAERSPIDLARRWVSDPRPLYKAWAAELIRRHELRFLAQELMGALNGVGPLDSHDTSMTDEDKMWLGILDTLIQLRVWPPPSVGQALFSRYPEPALVLLYGRGCPDVKVGAYVIDARYRDEYWLVAAQCLARQVGGPVELLQRLRIAAEVIVDDPNRRAELPPRVAEGPYPNRIRVSAPPDGWPELHTYQLAAGCDVGLGCTLLMGGRYPVYYVRESVREPVAGLGSHLPLDRNEDILELLADRLGMKQESLGVITHSSEELQWTTVEHYRSDLQAFVADHQRRYAELVSLLLRHRDLTPEESERCRPNLDIGVFDGRSDRRQPIPNIGVGDHRE